MIHATNNDAWNISSIQSMSKKIKHYHVLQYYMHIVMQLETFLTSSRMGL